MAKADIKMALRRALSDAYAFTQLSELNSGIEAITFDVLLQQELARLKEGEVGRMPPVLDRLNGLETRVHDALDKIKETDPQEFELIDRDEETNTEED